MGMDGGEERMEHERNAVLLPLAVRPPQDGIARVLGSTCIAYASSWAEPTKREKPDTADQGGILSCQLPGL